MYENEVDQTEGYAEWCAEKLGCKVVYPLSTQLQLDMDTEEQFLEYERRLGELLGWCEVDTPKFISITPSKSGLPHRHITITFNREFTDAERIGLQVFLGSDLVREKMNILRLHNGIARPCRLFELKDQP
jgi:hypothetical protein